MAEKDSTERRVYNLPADLLERLRAFQVDQGIGSEAEAVRRLLDSALQMKDSIDTILASLRAKFADERDLRVLAAEVLTKHALVKNVQIEETEVTFGIKTGECGKITSGGKLYSQKSEDNPEYWTDWPRGSEQLKPRPKARAVGGWDTRPPNDLDDEIPF